MRTLTARLRKYAAAVNHHVAAYRERLSSEEQLRISHLLLPPLPKQFRQRFVPAAEQRAAAQRQRKAKTDVVSECATAIVALMLARYPSMARFIRWYREQIEQVEAGEPKGPAHLVYADPHAYFVEVHSTDAMPWFIGPAADWYARVGSGQPARGTPAKGGTGACHAGVGTPEDRLATYLSALIASDRHYGRCTAAGVCF